MLLAFSDSGKTFQTISNYRASCPTIVNPDLVRQCSVYFATDAILSKEPVSGYLLNAMDYGAVVGRGDLGAAISPEKEKLRTAMGLTAEAIPEIEDAGEVGETNPTLDEGRISFIGDKLSKVFTVLTEISETSVQEGARSLEHALTTLADSEGEGPPASLVSMISCLPEQLASQKDEGSARTREVAESGTLVNDSGVPIHCGVATVISSTGEERQIDVLEDAGKQSEVELGALEEENPAVENILEMDGKEMLSSSLAMGEPGETKMTSSLRCVIERISRAPLAIVLRTKRNSPGSRWFDSQRGCYRFTADRPNHFDWPA
ncbi:hypothetical protein BSKO_10121 [Bryopsis sp. KO-2023]|nr:hypothetical protein BSKO_10121 [Bryopsis sp. KO-2023]